jgi:hypothetical protein
MSKSVGFLFPILLPSCLAWIVLDFALFYRILREFDSEYLAILVDFFGNGWYDRNRKT